MDNIKPHFQMPNHLNWIQSDLENIIEKLRIQEADIKLCLKEYLNTREELNEYLDNIKKL